MTVYLGYGREFAGRVGSGAGFSAYLIRNTWAPFNATGTIKKVDGKWGTAITKSHYQDHRSARFGSVRANGTHSLEADEALGERGIIRYATLEEFKANPNFAHEGEGRDTPEMGTSLFPNWTYTENKWGMSIDMNSCVGCNACIVSCYAENNIAVVGKQQVRIGRNMQWLRIDAYFEGDLATPRAHFQPMACQHCENGLPASRFVRLAPRYIRRKASIQWSTTAALVPATARTTVLIRVRRFNFLLYSDFETESKKLMRNPGCVGCAPRGDGKVQLLRGSAHSPRPGSKPTRKTARFGMARS